jgi:hypothetical protein
VEILGAKITRRRFLGAAAGGAAWVALAATTGCGPLERTRASASSGQPGRAWSFRSRPDLHPPVITVRRQARDTAPGYVFVAPKNGPDENGPGQDGCAILDNEGQPVWLHLLQDEAPDVMNFKVQTYRGEPVLTWWVGRHTGYGQGEYVILDRAYREVKRFGAGNGYDGDHHEFLITPQGTALITIYHKVPMDTSSMGGSANATVLDGIAQEIDIETGEVLFEWHSLKHVGLDESYSSKPYDYFHINSVDVYDDDHLLISSRNTWTLYKVNRKTGEVVWRFGGKKSDFEMGEGTRTAYQHDARWHGDGTLTVFDNGGGPWVHERSRAIRVELDEDAMKASLLREYTHPGKLRSATQGSVQILEGGNVFVGRGSEPFFSEFSRDGELLFDAHFPAEGESYRAFRFPWEGHPQDAPAIAVEPGPKDEVTLYASWNGATEATTWRVLAGPNPGELEPVGSVPWAGFETAMAIRTDEPYVALRAEDDSGRVLGTSKTLKARG